MPAPQPGSERTPVETFVPGSLLITGADGVSQKIVYELAIRQVKHSTSRQYPVPGIQSSSPGFQKIGLGRGTASQVAEKFEIRTRASLQRRRAVSVALLGGWRLAF